MLCGRPRCLYDLGDKLVVYNFTSYVPWLHHDTSDGPSESGSLQQWLGTGRIFQVVRSMQGVIGAPCHIGHWRDVHTQAMSGGSVQV